MVVQTRRHHPNQGLQGFHQDQALELAQVQGLVGEQPVEQLPLG